MFLPRGFAGFIMMHQTAWVHGRLKNLLAPYLITGTPGLACFAGAIALIEMSHSQEEVFHYLGLTLNPASIFSWAILIGLTGASAYLTWLSLRQLRDAWDTANSALAEKE
jgi:hypothetical protein